MPGHGRALGPPAALRPVRARRLLRQLAGDGRNEALPRPHAPARPVVPAGRGGVLLLRRRPRVRGARERAEPQPSVTPTPPDTAAPVPGTIRFGTAEARWVVAATVLGSG